MINCEKGQIKISGDETEVIAEASLILHMIYKELKDKYDKETVTGIMEMIYSKAMED